uniref:Uncharacterized protein n=1 Tax=Anguilla anguilla TaxID=7936 RepID=A0A0E9TIZ9_ANGAN
MVKVSHFICIVYTIWLLNPHLSMEKCVTLHMVFRSTYNPTDEI